MIEITDLQVSYSTEKVLDHVSFSVKTGEMVLITGPSGCGKSTLARVLAGIIPHSVEAEVHGHVQVAGFNPRNSALADCACHVGMVFQNPSSQLFHLKVYDEIAFGLRNIGLAEEELDHRIRWAMEATGILDLSDQVPGNLSGGQKQCVVIAAVLAMQPEVMILDEPTASLDNESIEQVIKTLEMVKKKLNLTIVMIEHRLTEVISHVDRLILMDKGKIISDCLPTSLHTDLQLVDRLGLRRISKKKVVHWNNLLQREPPTQSDLPPLLSINSVSAGYGRKKIIDDISFDLYPGDFTALVGPNGVGKSTLALVMAGLLNPMQGKVVFEGGRKPRPGLDIGLLFQNPIDQFFSESVDEEIAFGPLNYGCFNEHMHHTVLEQADLVHLRNRNPLTLSIGQQHRTALGACVALRPSVLILDEPTLGQDWKHLQQLMNYISKLNQQGTAIILISHDYKLVNRYAHKVIVMKDGGIEMQGCLERKKNSNARREICNEI